jgi:hypothetical protein
MITTCSPKRTLISAPTELTIIKQRRSKLDDPYAGNLRQR